MTKKPAVKKAKTIRRGHPVPKDNIQKDRVVRKATVATAHEFGHMLITGQTRSTLDNSIDWACFATLGKLALDFRAVITAEKPFAKSARQSAATSGRLISLILIREATAAHRTITINDIAEQINGPHPTVTGWVNWLYAKGLILRNGKRYWAADFDFSLMRRGLKQLKSGTAQSIAAIDALQQQIDREAQNHPTTEIKTESTTESKSQTTTKIEPDK